MRTLEVLLTILDGQKLNSGYLQSAGTAHDTVRALRQKTDPWVVLTTPLPNPNPLNTPAWVSAMRGTNAIYLNDVSGNLDTSHGPAYVFG